jgi:ribosomal protein L11 methyltransferase
MIMMRWLALDFATTHEAADLLVDYLSGLGAEGVEVQDAQEIRAILSAPNSLHYADTDFLNKLGETVRVCAYFVEFPEGVRCNREIDMFAVRLYDNVPKTLIRLKDLEVMIRDKIRDFSGFLDMGAGYLGFREIHEEDWAENWKKHYQTIHLTDRLVINPSWLDYSPAPDEIVISLDPGSAFGTGRHETTALCAEFLDELAEAEDRVLDLGTGSGILAIIAAKLGAGLVEAIDIDPLAVEVAKTNCAQNDVRINCHAGELSDALHETYDLIVANIIADVIAALASSIPNRLAKDGLFIASGIIKDKFTYVETAARQAGLELLVQRERSEWCAAVFRRIDC